MVISENEVVSDDPVMVAIREKLSQKVKTGFLELIPQEMFDNMADLAIDEFINGPRSKRFNKVRTFLQVDDERNKTGSAGYFIIEEPVKDYNAVSDSSTLPGIIYLEIVKMAKENITKIFKEDPRFIAKYDSEVGDNIVPIINEIVGNNTEAFIRSLMTNIVNFTMVQAINQLRNSENMNSYIPPVTGFRP